MADRTAPTPELIAEMRQAAEHPAMWNTADIDHVGALLTLAAERLESLAKDRDEWRKAAENHACRAKVNGSLFSSLEGDYQSILDELQALIERHRGPMF